MILYIYTFAHTKYFILLNILSFIQLNLIERTKGFRVIPNTGFIY